MKVVIIEDEQHAYKRLSALVTETFENATIAAHLDSVESAKNWFNDNPMPDIVFIDINLGDGTGFDVLNLVKIDCPFVFTTAYDQYAIDAFQTNSIAYLLKPITKEDLGIVVKKMDNYSKMFQAADVKKKPELPGVSAKFKKRFIIKFGEHIKILSVEEIAYCFTLNKKTFVRTFEGRTYPMDYNLEVLEEVLDPQLFFRINRQYLISLKSIEEMKMYSKARVIITLKPRATEQQIVSSDRAANFKHWLADEE